MPSQDLASKILNDINIQLLHRIKSVETPLIYNNIAILRKKVLQFFDNFKQQVSIYEPNEI